MIGRTTNFDDAGEFGLACGDDNGFVDRMRRSDRGDTLAARLFRRNPAARSMTARGGSSAPMAMTRPSPITSADPLPKARQIRLDGRGAPDFRVGAISDANRAEANGPGRAERAPSTAEVAGSPLQFRQ